MPKPPPTAKPMHRVEDWHCASCGAITRSHEKPDACPDCGHTVLTRIESKRY